VGWWDRAAIIVLGGAGCALSFDALQQMAVAIHVRPALTYLFPAVIDGFITYGIRALLVMSTAPLRARLYTWTLFATATTASIWANALHAVRLNQQARNSGLRLGDHVVAVLSTIAPLALAGAVHLYILITRHHPTRKSRKDRPGPDQPTTLVPVRADAGGVIRTGPQDVLGHAVCADRAQDRDHDLKHERTADRGPDKRTRAAADHAEGAPRERTAGRDRHADHDRADRPEESQHRPAGHPEGSSGPGGPGPAAHETAPSRAETDEAADPAVRPGDHGQQPSAAPQSASAVDTRPEATAPDPKGTSAGQPAPGRPTEKQGEDPSTGEQVPAVPSVDVGDRAEVRADRHEEAARDRGSADHARTARGTQSPGGTRGPKGPVDNGPRGDRPRAADQGSGPAEENSGPETPADRSRADHRPLGDPGPEKGAAARAEGAGDQQERRTAVRTGNGPARTGQESGDAAGLEELLSIAREAALTEGRMTRRALRPYLNQAGVPISNQRFTELQRRLYADPKLAHLPRPGRRS
jgi:hypothetical protein